jgi:hypothetical protein
VGRRPPAGVPVTTDYCCRVCRKVVDTYTPTGTRVLRAADHRQGRRPCSGRFGPVDPLAFVERERAATEAWRRARRP